jgi:hypothetical protein
MELVFFNPVFDRVEYHVHGFGALWWTVLLMIPYAVELSVLSSVASCLWPVKVPYVALTKTKPTSASSTKDTTCVSTVV